MKSIRISGIIFLLFCCLVFHAQNNQHAIDSTCAVMKRATGNDLLKTKVDLASYYIDIPEKRDSSFLLQAEVLPLAAAAKNELLVARCKWGFGLIYSAREQYDSALFYLLQALPYYEKINDLKRTGNLLSSIADIYTSVRNFPGALENNNRFLAIEIELRDTNQIINAYSGIASVYYYEDSIAKALSYYEKSYELAIASNNKSQAPYLLNNMASSYNDLAQYDKALEKYELALSMFKSQADSLNVAMCYANIGNVYNSLKKPELGISYIKKALDYSTRNNNNFLLAPSYNYLYDAYELTGDYKSAFYYCKKLKALDSLVYDKESSQNIADMRAKYDTEKKENENSLLKKNGEIKDLTNARQQVMIYIAIICFAIVALLAFFIFRSYRIKQKANLALEEKNNIIQEQNKDILDSIKYAKRIQEAIFPPAAAMKDFLKSAFIFYRPKDIVSGDFYWLEKKENKILVAAVDCTGHGVPGAFMSIVGYNLLNQAVNEHGITQPSLILDEINNGVTETLRQTEEESAVKDGMDIALCCIHTDTNTLEFSGAYNPLWIVRDEKLIELKPNKFPVGAFVGEKIHRFTNHIFELQKNDMIFLFSDGYADQFGGPEGKKFKYKEFQKLLVSNSGKPLSQQREILEKEFINWKGNLFQVDDVLVIGIRI